MDENTLLWVRQYGALTSEALVRLMSGDKQAAIQILNEIVFMLSAEAGNGDADSQGDAQGQQTLNPDQGSMKDLSSFWTVETWFGTTGGTPPTGPDGTGIPQDFIWAPNAPNSDSPDWATAEWVWRPSLSQ